jgi:hypothetical protein
MNERIDKLLVKAGAYFGGDGVVYDTFDPKKFAELIVREMLQTCEDHPAWTGRMIGEEIKEHFGVEE